MSKTIAIAGAGIAGLTAAAALAQRGHDVTVYESRSKPSEIGAGLYLKENALQVLDQLGIYDEIEAKGQRIYSAKVFDDDGHLVIDRDVSSERLVISQRTDLHSGIMAAALAAGATIVTNARAVGADPKGKLFFDDGETIEADLVIGADGVHSRIRESLGLGKFAMVMGDGATRYIIPRQGEGDLAIEFWSGHLRAGIVPCGPEHVYMYLGTPDKDLRAARIPLDKPFWKRHFPMLAAQFDRVEPGTEFRHQQRVQHCLSWYKGKAVIIGDAAHPQPANLGQGAGVSMVSALELAEVLDYEDDVRDALAAWYSGARHRIDVIQRMTTVYDLFAYKFPRPMLPVKVKLFQWFSGAPGNAERWAHYWRGGLLAPSQAVAPDLPALPRGTES